MAQEEFAPQAEAAPPSVFATTFKTLLAFGVVCLLLGMVAGGLIIALRVRNANPEPMSAPLLLSMQKIGQLHTIAYRMKDAIHVETQSEPSGAARVIPGVEQAFHWATRNEALVTAEGSVEAGVDLAFLTEKDVTRIKQDDGTIRLRVHLPPIIVYPPTVRVRVEDTKAGLFWNDKNIVPKAQAQASRRFQEAAEKDGIRAQAETNAIELLQKMQSAFGSSNVEFTFAPPSPAAR